MDEPLLKEEAADLGTRGRQEVSASPADDEVSLLTKRNYQFWVFVWPYLPHCAKHCAKEWIIKPIRREEKERKKREEKDKIDEILVKHVNDSERVEVEFSSTIHAVRQVEDGMQVKLTLKFEYKESLIEDVFGQTIPEDWKSECEECDHEKAHRKQDETFSFIPYMITNAMEFNQFSYTFSRHSSPEGKTMVRERIEAHVVLTHITYSKFFPFEMDVLLFKVQMDGTARSNLVNLRPAPSDAKCRAGIFNRHTSRFRLKDQDDVTDRVCRMFLRQGKSKRIPPKKSSTRDLGGGSPSAPPPHTEPSKESVVSATGSTEVQEGARSPSAPPPRTEPSKESLVSATGSTKVQEGKLEPQLETTVIAAFFFETDTLENLIKYIGTSTVMFFLAVFLPAMEVADIVQTGLGMTLANVGLLYVLPPNDDFTATEKIIVGQIIGLLILTFLASVIQHLDFDEGDYLWIWFIIALGCVGLSIYAIVEAWRSFKGLVNQIKGNLMPVNEHLERVQDQEEIKKMEKNKTEFGLFSRIERDF